MYSVVYDLWLSLALTPDTDTFKVLLSEFSDSKSIFDADKETISIILP